MRMILMMKTIKEKKRDLLLGQDQNHLDHQGQVVRVVDLQIKKLVIKL